MAVQPAAACMTFRDPSPCRTPGARSNRSVGGWRSPAAGLLLGVFLFAGCDDPGMVRPGDVRVYQTSKEPRPSSPPGEPAPVRSEPRGGLTLRYEPPAGWTDRGASGMRLASLAIGDPSAGHEVTVIPAAGTVEANVTRWIGQLAPETAAATLAERTQAALAAAETIEVDGVTATIVVLSTGAEPDAPGDEAILGAVIPLDETASLFVKFKGPAEVARRERDNFVRFVSSIRWK